MKKQILSLAVVSTLSLGSIVSPLNASAGKISDLNQQKQEVLNEKDGLSSEIQEKKAKVGELKTEQEKINAEVKRLDFAVSDAEQKIEVKNGEIKQTTVEIEKLKVEIKALMERIDKRNELLKDKARSIQENGGSVSYLDVLLGAQSFSDFIDRVNAVATIVEADKGILEQHQKDKQELETKQVQVETKLADLQKMKKDLEGLRVKLNSQIAEKNELMKELKHEEEQMHKEIVDIAEQQEILAGQASAIQKAIELEKQRQAAIAAEKARQAELEKQRAAAAAKNNGNGSNSSSPAPSVQAPPPASSGKFMMPANGRITSGIGNRWGSFHAGVDIANRASGVPIVAAADGVVSRSYYSSSYGNVVFISHYMDGQVWTTVYAHMSSRAVGTGAVVSKGTKLGIMGNTGQSFGQHLHFELHKGEWNARKSNAVNPLAYM